MSPERQAAQLAVEESIERLREIVAREDVKLDDNDGMLTGWATVISRTTFDGEGAVTAVSVFHPDTMPDWQVVGLLRAGGLLAEDPFREPGSRT